MKQIAVLAVLLGLVCVFPTAAQADNWGLGVKLGIAENNPEAIKHARDFGSFYGLTSDMEKNLGVFGL